MSAPSPLLLSRRAALLWLAGLSSLALGCAPRFDWREVVPAAGGYAALFPGRPQTATREVAVGGHRVRLTLTSAHVGAAWFAVGHADAPGAAPAVRDALRQAMNTNLRGTEVESRRVRVGEAIGDEVQTRGSLKDAPAWMLARYVLAGDRVYEVMALGPVEALPQEAAETFVTGFKLTGR